MNVLERSAILLTILGSLSTSYAAGGGSDSSASGGTNGGGGGNALVCFSSAARAKAIAGEDTFDKAHEIPDEALSEITSIQMLDLSDALWAHQDKKPELYQPKNPIAQVTLDDWKRDRRVAEAVLETEFNRYIERFARAIPEVYATLVEAQAALSLPKLGVAMEDGKLVAVEQIDDFNIFRHGQNCVVSTMFNQWWNGSPANSKWKVDGRLFFHQKNQFWSQVVGLLHERSYWIGRKVLFVPSSAGGVYFFTEAMLSKKVTYRETMRYYNSMFIESGLSGMISVGRIGPLLELQQQWAEIYAVSGGNLQALQALYEARMRSQVLSMPLVEPKYRKHADQNLREFFKTGQVNPVEKLLGWPADFASSNLPPLK